MYAYIYIYIYTLRIPKLTKYGQLDILLTCEIYFRPTPVINPAIMKNSEIWQFPLNIDKIGTMRWSILANIPVDFHQNCRAYSITQSIISIVSISYTLVWTRKTEKIVVEIGSFLATIGCPKIPFYQIIIFHFEIWKKLKDKNITLKFPRKSLLVLAKIL